MKSMSRIFMCFGFLTVQLSHGSYAAPEIKNPSFEEPVEQGNWSCDRAAGWDRRGAWFNRETTWSPVLQGECLMAYHHWQIKQDDPSELFQDITGIVTGKNFCFSIQVFKDKGTNFEYVELRVEPAHGGTPISSAVYRMPDLKSDRWTPLSVSVKSPTSSALRVVISVKPGRSNQRKGALKFDEASISENAPPGNGANNGLASPRINNMRLSAYNRITQR